MLFQKFLNRVTRDSYDGFLLNINKTSWDRIHKHARNSVRKAAKNGVIVQESGEYKQFKKIYPRDRLDRLPQRLSASQKLFLAQHNGEIVGGIVVEKAWPIIRYKHAATTDEGKRLQANSLLLWHVVEYFEGQGYKYLVLGWSCEEGIERFKKSFATEFLLVPQKYLSYFDKGIHRNVLIVFEKDPLDREAKACGKD